MAAGASGGGSGAALSRDGFSPWWPRMRSALARNALDMPELVLEWLDSVALLPLTDGTADAGGEEVIRVGGTTPTGLDPELVLCAATQYTIHIHSTQYIQ